jgi:hypothetical protein
VLVKVLPVLLMVPFKSHGLPRLGENTVLARIYQYICMYSLLEASRAQKVEIDSMESNLGKSATFADMAERVGLKPQACGKLRFTREIAAIAFITASFQLARVKRREARRSPKKPKKW